MGSSTPRIVALIGTGRFGHALARSIIQSGHKVRAANSRGPSSLASFVESTGAEAVDITTIGKDADFLILALPLGRAGALAPSVFASLPDNAVVIDATNYVPYNDGVLEQIEQGLTESEWLSSQLNVPVVKTFNSIFDNSLENCKKAAGAEGRIALPVSGDDQSKINQVMDFVESLGFDAYDAGPLQGSWRQQIGQSCWCSDLTKSELDSVYKKADVKSVNPNRNTSMKMAKKVPADFPRQDLVRVSRLMAGFDLLQLTSYIALIRLLTAMLFSSK